MDFSLKPGDFRMLFARPHDVATGFIACVSCLKSVTLPRQNW